MSVQSIEPEVVSDTFLASVLLLLADTWLLLLALFRCDVELPKLLV